MSSPKASLLGVGEHTLAERSSTWPPTTVCFTSVADARNHTSTLIPIIKHATPSPTMQPSRPRPIHPSFEDELNQDPAAHFLSPVSMYELEDWADESEADEDDDDHDNLVQWDAGITDFALFHNDRKQAQERREQLPDRWEKFLASQASALQRAVQRNQSNSNSNPTQKWTPLLEDIPHLTPDNSPTLKDDFDMEAHCGPSRRTLRRRPTIPNYLQHQQQSPPSDSNLSENDSNSNLSENDSNSNLSENDSNSNLSENDSNSDLSDDDDEYISSDEDEDEDSLPIAYLVSRARERRRHARKMERPGLRFNRTMSGKVHVWRRPSWHLNDVREDVEAEEREERVGEGGRLQRARGRRRA